MFNIDTGQSKDPKVILNRFVKERISSFQRSMLVRLPRKRTLVVFLFLNAFIFEADSQITVLHLSSNSTSGVTGTWTVPTGVSKIRITAKGAKGGYGNNGGSNRTYFYGGNGATISGEFVVNAGQTLEAVAGGIGGDFQYSNGGGSGGGGSGVRIQNGSDLIIAGGGGGGGNTVAGGGSSSIGGLGNGGAGGGGLYSNGGAGGGGLNSAGGNGAAGRTGGGAGFNASGGVGSAFPGGGGYGGGGAGYFGGGGGGGYTGGAGGDAGGGGTSYNTGANQTFSGSSNNDFGDVIIEILGQAKCKDITVNANNNCTVTIAASDINDGSFYIKSDGSYSTLTYSLNSPSGFTGIGDHLALLNVTNDVNETSTCFSKVTIVDNIAPSITCPSSVTVNTQGQCGVNVSFNAVTASDNCSGNGFTNFPVGEPNNAYYNPVENYLQFGFGGTWNDLFNTASLPSIVEVNSVTSATQNGYTNLGSFGGHTYYYSTSSTSWTNAQNAAVSIGGNLASINSYDEELFLIKLLYKSVNPYAAWVGGYQDTNAPDYVEPGNQTQNFGGWRWLDGTKFVGANVTITPGNSNIASNGFFPIGPTTNTYTATDASNNTSNCSFTVTVKDVEAPKIICPPNQSINLDANCNGTLPNYTSLVQVSDNCPNGLSAVRQSLAAGTTVNAPGTLSLTFTVTDASNNSNSCTISVEKKDVTPPVITCPANISVNTAPNTCGAVVTFNNATATDNCSALTGNISGYTKIGTLGTSTYYLSDASGTWSSANADAVAHGGHLVTITSQAENDLVQGSTNSPFWIGLTDIPTYGGNNNLDFHWVTGEPLNYTDWIPGDPNNPGVEHYGVAKFVGGWINGSNGDNFPLQRVIEISSIAVSQTTNYVSGQSVFPVGTTTVSYSAKDPSNNTASCAFTVTVTDNENPKIVCPSDISVNTDPGVCGAKVQFSDATATDNCSATVTQTTSYTSGQTFPVGTTTITYSAKDPSNNTVSCSFNVVVTDNEAPKITCPTNIYVNTDLGVCGAKVQFSDATATDNCSATVTQTTSYTSGQTFPVGTTTIIYSAKDPSNNTVSCSFNVVVTDNEAPKITCPANISVNTDLGVCGAKVQFSDATATDNCSATVTQTTSYTSGQTFPVGTTTITYSAKDPSNNTVSCSFNVVVTDNEAPKITCPANISVNTDLGVCGAKVQFSAATTTDNCSATVTQTTSYTSGQTFPVGTTTITYSAKDPSNNTVSCSFNVVVTDNEAPKITCPANISVNTDLGVCGAKVQFSAATATDNCSATVTQTTSYTSGQTFPVGTTTISYSAKDPSNNTATCSFNVVIKDNEAPKVTCPSDISVNTDPGVCGAKVNFTVSATDNCSFIANLTGLASGSIFPVGKTINVFKATDASNNTSTCTFNVVVTDNEAPKITCPANISVNTDLGVCGAKVSFAAATATDNCSATVTQSTAYTSGQTFPVGTTTITYSAKDPSNNTAACSFSVVVKDKETPKITCPASVTKSSDVGICGAKYSFSTPTATDNCSAVVTQTSGLTSGSTFPVGVNTVTFTATDPSGNTTSCSFTVTVNSLASFNPNVCYNIVNKSSGLPIVLEGSNAYQYSAKQTKVQSFKLVLLPNGNLKIVSSSDKNGKSLSDEAPKDNNQAKLKNYDDDKGQSDWQINCSNGYYIITHKASGQVLTVGTSKDEGKTPIVVAAANGSNSQLWSLVATTCSPLDDDLQSKTVSNITGYAETQRNVIDFTTNQGLTTDFYTAEKINKVSGNFEVLEQRANKEVTDKVKFVTFYDNAPYEGDNMYRIKTTFLDGSVAYSNVQIINTKVAADFTVFPNPTDEEAWIDLKAFAGKEVTLTVSDLAGKTLQSEVIKEAATAPHHLDLSGFTTGLYFIKVQTAGRQIQTKKLQVAN